MLFEIAKSLRSLTHSPFQAALNEARKMARRHLETGGPATAPRKQAKPRPQTAEFVLPLDLGAMAVAEAIREKLGDDAGGDALYPLERKKLGGRVVLRGGHVLRLGDGRFSEGRAFLHGLENNSRLVVVTKDIFVQDSRKHLYRHGNFCAVS